MATANEPKSVSMIIKQRQQSRSATLAPKAGGKNSGAPGSGGNKNENLNPVLPPLYPPAPKPSALDPDLANSVKVYSKLSQYFRSNFSVAFASKGNDGFYVDRYTDQYKSPLALKPHLLQKLPNSRYPDELTRKTVSYKPIVRKMKRKIEDLPDADDPEKPAKKAAGEEDEENEEEAKEETNLDDIEENEEELDEEMDVGTDYALSYFDNGEGDEDDRDEEDGPTY